ncbi:MAG: O-antigen ligase family protein [Spirochaetales bacterium]|nr:O-antigen ligase family protein [Spirochaetales bacterium]
MKYILFAVAAVLGIPIMTFSAISFSRLRQLLVAFLILSIMAGSLASINFVSMEHYRGPVRGFEVTFTDLIAIALFFYLIMTKASSIKWFPKLFVTGSIFFLYSLVNVFASPSPLLGQFVLWQLFRAGFLYWCMFNLIYTERSSKEIMDAIWLGFVLLGIFMSLIAFKQKYLDGIYRVPAFFDHSNTIPSYLILILSLLMVWGMASKKLNFIQYLLTMFSSLGILFTIFATGSRGGYAVTAGSVFAVLVISNFRKKRVRAHIQRIILSTGVIVFALIIGGAMVIDTVVDRFLNAPESSAGAREEFNIAAEMMAEDAPIGVGLNLFSQVLTYNESYRSHLVTLANEEHAGVAHHIYLLTAAELGYPGLILFILTLMRILLPIVFRGLHWKYFHHILLLGIAVGMAAFFALGLLEWVFRLTPVLYQFSIVSALGLSLVTLEKEKLLDKHILEEDEDEALEEV